MGGSFWLEEKRGVGRGVGGRDGGVVWVLRGGSLLIRAAAVQRVNHEGQVRPRRHHGVTRLHHLKAHVVERPDDGNWWGNKERSSSSYLWISAELVWPVYMNCKLTGQWLDRISLALYSSQEQIIDFMLTHFLFTWIYFLFFGSGCVLFHCSSSTASRLLFVCGLI